MQSTWTDRDADAAIARYENLGRDVALRVYTTLIRSFEGQWFDTVAHAYRDVAP